MDCPVCGQPMVDKSYNYYGIAEWDMDYPVSYHEEYKCTKCGSALVNGEWKVPVNKKATYKQVKCARFIARKLGIDPPPPTRQLMWKFIHENLPKVNRKDY